MYLKRRQQLFAQLQDQTITLLFSGKAPYKTADQKYPFVVNKNFYYLTGLSVEEAVLIMIKGVNQTDSYIFVPNYDPIKALWDGAALDFKTVAKITEIKEGFVRGNNTIEQFISQIVSSSRRAIYGSLSQVNFDFDRLEFDLTTTLNEEFSKTLVNKYPYLTINNIHSDLAKLRMIKDKNEIDLISKAISISDQAIRHLLNVIPKLRSEAQINAEYNYILNKEGLIPSFNSIIASGKNAAILHYVDNNSQLDQDGLVLLDMGVEYEQYASDISRTFPVSGKFNQRQRDVYEAVLSVNKAAIEWVKPGYSFAEFNQYGKDLLINEAKKLKLIKNDEEINDYYYHSLTHSLGLDVHDIGDYTKKIEAGMILTVEPGLYIAAENIGVRIEDNILITTDGAINLSEMIPKEVAEIEKLMK